MASTRLTDINEEIIESHILSRLNASTLSSTALVSPLLHAMSMKDRLWKDLCTSTWNSTKHPRVQYSISTFPGGHRSLFSDSFPLLCHDESRSSRHQVVQVMQASDDHELISAVDIHYNSNLAYSKVDVINISDSNSLDSTSVVELLGEKERVRMPVKYELDVEEDVYLWGLKENMSLSWIIIDPMQKRAVNVSSVRPVTVRPHWVDGDIEVKYASIVAGDCMSELVELRVVVKLGWKDGGELELRKVNLRVLDMDGNCLSGKGSLGILMEAIRSGKRVKGKKGEETERYRKYVNMKRERREGKLKRRRGMPLFPVAAATIVVAFIFMSVFVFILLS